jgi:hypothetical protein
MLFLRSFGGCPIKKLLFPAFRPRAAHIVIFGPVFPDRPVPGRTEKRHQRAGGAAGKGNENGCGERKLSHLTLHAKGELELADAKWLISSGLFQCSRTLVRAGSRVTELSLDRSKRTPRSSSSRCMRRSFELAIASIMFFK